MENLADIPGYIIKQRVGQGSLAKIYSGLSQESESLVAIKILERRLAREPEIAKRFLQEAQTGADLEHPNIIKIHQVGCTDRCYFMVMEYLEKSLRDKLNSRLTCETQSQSLLKDLHILIQVAEALDYAHKQGVVHRDIKPENIMFRSDGTPVLVDFGLAKIKYSSEKLTKTGVAVGTPQYMSPEQIEGKRVDGRTDIYSLGVVLYELLSGEAPYKADDYITLAMKHLKKKIPKLPRKLRHFQPLVNMMMAKDPADRIPNGEAVIKKIIKHQNQLP